MNNTDIKIASCLAALFPNDCTRFCELKGIDSKDVVPADLSTPESIVECMNLFQANGISLQYVFLNTDVWCNYLCSFVEERYHPGTVLTVSGGNPADLLLYFRACYRFGFPAVDDNTYDALEMLYIQAFPALDYLNKQTYDDDKYPSTVLEALKMSKVRYVGKQAKLTHSDLESLPGFSDLNSDKSTSIRPVTEAEEAFEFWKEASMCRVHFSLKIDGVNTKVLFGDNGEGLKLAISRGRATDSIDYTEAIRRMINVQGIDASGLHGKVTGESFVSISDLEILQKRYRDKNYKSPKSAAMAMLRAPDNFTVDDYSLLSFRGFDYNGDKPDTSFSGLSDCGFVVPPYLEFEGKDIPRDSLESFNTWMNDNVLNPLFEKGIENGIGSDGVVMYLLADINTERKDKYSDSNIAIKYGPWAAVTYESVVKDILFEQKRVEASIVLEVEPVVMRDLNTATRVGVGSPDILITDDVRVGDTILFERKSEAYNVYLGKKQEVKSDS